MREWSWQFAITVGVVLIVVSSLVGKVCIVNGDIYPSIKEAKIKILDSCEPVFEQSDLNQFVKYDVNMQKLEKRSGLQCIVDLVMFRNYNIEVQKIIDRGALRKYLASNYNGVDIDAVIIDMDYGAVDINDYRSCSFK